jgi:hypothetical protein
MKEYVADIAAPPTKAAVSISNSEFPSILMILHLLLQNLQRILLLQRTFEKRENVNKNKRKTAILANTSLKNALTPSTIEGSEHMSEELGQKYKKEKCKTLGVAIPRN